MKCEEAGRFLDAYLDNELELSQRLELEQHLSLCVSCWSLAQERQEFRFSIRASAPKYRAPPQLRTKVLATAQREKTKLLFALLHQPWAYAAAAFVLSLSLALNILFPDAGKEVSREAVLRSSRSIFADHLVDVASANPQVVKFLADRETRFFSTGGWFPCVGVLPPWRTGRCDPKSFGRDSCLQK